jgi:uncharacterized protein (TIGR03067 family)
MRKLIVVPITCVLFVGGFGAPGGAGDKEDAIKADMKLLQGVWLMQSFESNGNPLPAEQAQKIKVTVKGDKYMVDLGERKFEATFTIDPTKKPKAIDVTMTLNEEKAVTLGIYEVSKDTFKICRTMEAGAERPKEFSTKEGSGTVLAVYKREKK